MSFPVRSALQMAADDEYQRGFREGFAKAREEAASLCEQVRCRQWSPEECARQIRERVRPEGTH